MRHARRCRRLPSALPRLVYILRLSAQWSMLEPLSTCSHLHSVFYTCFQSINLHFLSSQHLILDNVTSIIFLLLGFFICFHPISRSLLLLSGPLFSFKPGIPTMHLRPGNHIYVLRNKSYGAVRRIRRCHERRLPTQRSLPKHLP